MADNCVFIADEGTEIILDTENDISSGSIFLIYYEKPSGDTGTWTGALEGTTQVKYVTNDSSLDEVGDWSLQAHITLPAWSGFGCRVILTVKSHIAL